MLAHCGRSLKACMLRGIITLDLAKIGALNQEKYHIKKYCFKWKRENEGGGDKHNRNDDEKFERVVAATREDLLVICDENLVNLTYDETSWVIDNGASIHVMSRRDFFMSHTPGTVDVAVNDNSTKLWHKQLGYIIGKQRRVYFRSHLLHRRSELLELVHLDVSGPIKTIDNIDKTEKEDSPDSGDLTNVNLIPLDPSPNPIQDDVHGDLMMTSRT
ncbi:hypothetical protein V6N11_081186 [Hibiscus sabdariffa]|uniref:Uncharacterized protein n=1 Tax=Hibiscus sabdariffa TaxID=183260 RepID=A0ABR2QJL2_9ROSI